MAKGNKAGIGMAAVTGVAIAAAYYLYGSEKAAEHRKEVKSWATKAEKEILQKTKQLKQAALTDETIQAIVGEVAKRYEMTKKIDSKDVRAFVSTVQKGLRAAHTTVKKKVAETAKAAKTAQKSAQKSVKKTVKKVVKKAKA